MSSKKKKHDSSGSSSGDDSSSSGSSSSYSGKSSDSDRNKRKKLSLRESPPSKRNKNEIKNSTEGSTTEFVKASDIDISKSPSKMSEEEEGELVKRDTVSTTSKECDDEFKTTTSSWNLSPKVENLEKSPLKSRQRSPKLGAISIKRERHSSDGTDSDDASPLKKSTAVLENVDVTENKVDDEASSLPLKSESSSKSPLQSSSPLPPSTSTTKARLSLSPTGNRKDGKTSRSSDRGSDASGKDSKSNSGNSKRLRRSRSNSNQRSKSNKGSRNDSRSRSSGRGHRQSSKDRNSSRNRRSRSRGEDRYACYRPAPGWENRGHLSFWQRRRGSGMQNNMRNRRNDRRDRGFDRRSRSPNFRRNRSPRRRSPYRNRNMRSPFRNRDTRSPFRNRDTRSPPRNRDNRSWSKKNIDVDKDKLRVVDPEFKTKSSLPTTSPTRRSSSPSSSDSGSKSRSSSNERKRKQKKGKHGHKDKKDKKKKKKHKKHKKSKRTSKDDKRSVSVDRNGEIDALLKEQIITTPEIVPLEPTKFGGQELAKKFAPMSEAEYQKRQNTFRRELDPQTGRNRLIKGDGEIVEEPVSKSRHLSINKEATKQDGLAFQTQLQMKLKR